jgi:hypothetical protein
LSFFNFSLKSSSFFFYFSTSFSFPVPCLNLASSNIC